MSFLGGLFGGGGGGQDQGPAFRFMGQGLGAIGRNFDRARDEYRINYYDPYSRIGEQGTSAYADSLGLNGPEGRLAALGRFQSGPGYQFALDQGTDAISRQAAARGTLAGGGTSADLLRFGQGLANQEYGGWQDRLRGLGEQGLTAAGGQTGRQGALAGISTDQGRAEANIYGGMADLYRKGLDRKAEDARAGQRNLIALLAGGANLAGRAFLPA